jgi:hypothetical protein
VLATEPKEAPSVAPALAPRLQLNPASLGVIESLEAMETEVDAALFAVTP